MARLGASILVDKTNRVSIELPYLVDAFEEVPVMLGELISQVL